MQRLEFDSVFFGEDPLLEYASDCPVRYEVWLAYALEQHSDSARPSDVEAGRHDLMVNVAPRALPDEVTRLLIDRLGPDLAHDDAMVAGAGEFIAVTLTFQQLVQHLMPLTSLAPLLEALETALGDGGLLENIIAAGSLPDDEETADQQIHGRNRRTEAWERLIWLARLLIATYLRRAGISHYEEGIEALRDLFDWNGLPQPVSSGAVLRLASPERPEAPVAAITVNRLASASVRDSRRTVKADAASALFGVSCASITWAILDSGIDASHPAFAERDADGRLSADDTGGSFSSRVSATYDFTKFREILAQQGGQRPDWTALEPQLRLEHRWASDDTGYRRPLNDHGTHVAGILGADWPEEELTGICPDIRLWDIRVLDDDGQGNEFNILAALQFIRWANERSARPEIAGANLSLALAHEVANYSCGWTPVCVECDKLVRSGVVVVTVAGNAAFDPADLADLSDGTSYRTISITDPGNAESVITVGATHRTDPHRHGASYFSGRGPTADGRVKPDLLAPGERVDGPTPDCGIRRMSGTSQAAPHVSGAAALLLARYRELLGRPERIKQVLCESATDLGRAPTFQGHGMLDVLRAMQTL